MSDVVGNDLQYIASGTTVPDFTTPQQCLDLLDSMKLTDITPRSVLRVLEEKARLPEFTKDIVGHGENIDLEQVSKNTHYIYKYHLHHTRIYVRFSMLARV